MIAFLEGVLAGKTPQAAYLNVNGVGYAVSLSQLSLAKLPEVGERVRVLTYLQVSETGIALYGFLSEEERTMFEQLISVSGVGPKVALAALSTFKPADLAAAIAAQDIALVQKIPGVGKKSASRIVLELKGSLDLSANLFDAAPEAPASSKPVVNDALKDVAAALLSMGFTSAEVDLALKDAPQDASEAALLQYALKRLGGR